MNRFFRDARGGPKRARCANKSFAHKHAHTSVVRSGVAGRGGGATTTKNKKTKQNKNSEKENRTFSSDKMANKRPFSRAAPLTREGSIFYPLGSPATPAPPPQMGARGLEAPIGRIGRTRTRSSGFERIVRNVGKEEEEKQNRWEKPSRHRRPS